MTGEYAGFVMTAYGIAALLLGGVIVQSICAWRRVKKEAEGKDEKA